MPDASAKRTATEPLDPEIDSPDRKRLPPLLRRAWYSLNQAFRRRITHLEITPDQFTVLRILEEHREGMTQKEICTVMSSDPNTIASLVGRMDDQGLVERRPHEKDRRALRVRILASGRRKYSAARDIAVSLQSEALSVLPEDNRDAFLAALESVAAACRAAAEKSPR
jgi:DNA-binding MarR family transcriptional regulator